MIKISMWVAFFFLFRGSPGLIVAVITTWQNTELYKPQRGHIPGSVGLKKIFALQKRTSKPSI